MTLTEKQFEAGLKRRLFYLDQKDVKVMDLDNLFAREHGCARCPHRYARDCPHGVGTAVAPEDVYIKSGPNKGAKLYTKGDLIKRIPGGICDERIVELGAQFELAGNLTGLKQKRAQSLVGLETDIGRLRAILGNHFEQNPDGELVATDDGDVKLSEALMQLSQLHGKYHDKIDQAIKQESRMVEKEERKVTADDINKLLSDAATIEVEYKVKEDE